MLKGYAEKIRLQRWVAWVGMALLLIKFIAFFITQSNAILTDALESIVNVVAGWVAFYSLIVASRPKDEDHPYGHGKMEYISASIEGALIVAAALAILAKSGYNLLHPQQLQSLDMGIVLTACAGLVNYFFGRYLSRKGASTHSITLLAGGKHLLSDAYSSLGLIVGLAIAWVSGLVWVDNLVALGFGLYIGSMGIRILKQSVDGIMDKSDVQTIKELIALLEKNRKAHWIDIHNLRVINYGSRLHLDCHVTVPWYYNVKQGHDVIAEIDLLIQNEAQREMEFFIHTDPCLPESCSICKVVECPERRKAYEHTVNWNWENVTSNRKHSAKIK